MSTACGIPDFRSKNFGLFDTIANVDNPLTAKFPDLKTQPDLLFSRQFVSEHYEYETGTHTGHPVSREWERDVHELLKLADDRRAAQSAVHCKHSQKEDSSPQPSLTHLFCGWLERNGWLQRVYSQNIDGLHSSEIADPEVLEGYDKDIHGAGAVCSRGSSPCTGSVEAMRQHHDPVEIVAQKNREVVENRENGGSLLYETPCKKMVGPKEMGLACPFDEVLWEQIVRKVEEALPPLCGVSSEKVDGAAEASQQSAALLRGGGAGGNSGGEQRFESPRSKETDAETFPTPTGSPTIVASESKLERLVSFLGEKLGHQRRTTSGTSENETNHPQLSRDHSPLEPPETSRTAEENSRPPNSVPDSVTRSHSSISVASAGPRVTPKRPYDMHLLPPCKVVECHGSLRSPSSLVLYGDPLPKIFELKLAEDFAIAPRGSSPKRGAKTKRDSQSGPGGGSHCPPGKSASHGHFAHKAKDGLFSAWSSPTKNPKVERTGGKKNFSGKRDSSRRTSAGHAEEPEEPADLLLVFGTSLQVAPFCGVPNLCTKNCTRVLVNSPLKDCLENGWNIVRKLIS